MFKVKPWWLRILTPAHAWVTIHPNIYVPRGVDVFSFPEVVAHEKVHLRQQEALGRGRWLREYLLRSSFRLQQEAEAVATELLSLPKDLRPGRLAYYSAALSDDGGTYDPPFGDPAAYTFHDARVAILSWMEKISPGSTHDLH